MARRAQRFAGRSIEHAITAAKSNVHCYGPHSITAMLCAGMAMDWSRDMPQSMARQPSVGCVATY